MSYSAYDPEELIRLRKLPELIPLIPRVLLLIWQVSPWMVIFIGVMAVISGLVPPAILFLMKLIVDTVAENRSVDASWLIVIVPLAIIFGLWVGSAVLDSINNLVETILYERTENTTNKQLLDKACKLDIAFFEAPKFYDQLQQANEHQWSLQSLPIQMFSLLQQVLQLGALIGLLSLLHPLAFVALVVTVLPRFFLEGHMTRASFKLHTELTRTMRQLQYSSEVLIQREKAKEIRIFKLGDMFRGRFLDFRDVYISNNRKLLLRFMAYNISLSTISTLGVGAVSIYAVIQAAEGSITVGTLTMVFGAAQQVVGLIGGLISMLNSVYQTSLESSRFFELMDLDLQSIDGALAPPPVESPAIVSSDLKHGIELEHVSFSYPAVDSEVLTDVSFFIPAKSKVAIVGENGAGKTTLVKLLARFYDPVSGSIKLDGRDYREYDLDSLRAQLSVVFQDFVRYDISASENVGVGNIEAIDDRQRVIAAARNCGADKVISGLPRGYDTVLGRTMDEGVDLSGGEWQQISIARAFMSETPILILDEPTAAMDSLRERELYEQIHRLSQDKTVVFISHRFSTVRMADLIVVIEDGKTIEVGSHDELVKQQGKYFRMFETQAERYR